MNSKQFAKCAIALAISSVFTGQVVNANELDSSKQDQDVEQLKKIERVQVWGTEVKASSVYMGGAEIATKQADHISDLLRTIPGVDVGGAHSLNQRITIRSMDDKDLRITIDGANQNTYMYHHMGNLQIHADILKSVDIEVGSNSVINGGLGGAVHFETKEAKDLLREGETFGGRVQGSYADNASSSFSLTGYGQLSDSFDFLAYYNFVNRDNYSVGGKEILNADGNVVPGTDGEVRGLEGKVNDALIKFGWDFDADQRFELGYESYQDKGDYSYRPDMGLATDTAITASLEVPLLWPTKFTRDTLTANYDLSWGDSSSLKVAVFTNESSLNRDESGYANNPKFTAWAGDITGTATNTGMHVIGNSLLGDSIEHELTYGMDVVKYKTDYEKVFLNGDIDNANEEAINSSAFIEDRIDFGNGFAIIPGVRFDSYDIESTVVDDTFSQFSAALAAEYSFNNNFIVKASSTQLFKGPEIGEVFTGAGKKDTANPGIEAETGFNHEIAFAYDDNVLGADSFTAGITLFKTTINDYIYDWANVPGGGKRDYWKDNIGDMTVDGFEFYTGYALGQLNLQLTYSVAESELDAFADYAELDGGRLDRQQGDTISASADYSFESLDLVLHWDMLVVDDLDDGLTIDGPSLDNSKMSYSVHNLSVNWQPEQVDGLSLIFGIDNVFDEFYASQSSHTGVSFHPLFGKLYLMDYEPGRNIKATIAYQF
ncbi:MAG: TonB-dependent receptor [Alteromonadales bacterium]|nr:TonB-dependent receptor [Alteromonadales bacterium]